MKQRLGPSPRQRGGVMPEYLILLAMIVVALLAGSPSSLDALLGAFDARFAMFVSLIALP